MTRFLFGLIDQQGTPYLIQTYEYRISGANNSNLVKFLTQWLGRPPEMGWDYCELQGQGAMVSVAHQQSKGTPPKTYAKITGISPVFEQLRAQLPPASHFDQLIAQAEQATQALAQQRAAQQQQGQAPAQTPSYQQGGYANPAAMPPATPEGQGFHQPPTSHPPAAPQQIVPPQNPAGQQISPNPTYGQPPANAGFPPQHAAPSVPPQPPTAAGAGFPPQPPSQGDVIEDTPF